MYVYVILPLYNNSIEPLWGPAPYIGNYVLSRTAVKVNQQ